MGNFIENLEALNAELCAMVRDTEFSEYESFGGANKAVRE
jgi:hypothetical protein